MTFSLTLSRGEQIKEKYQYGYHLKTVCQNDQKSNQHTSGAHAHIHTKYEVPMTIFHQLSIDIKEKYQNGCHLKTLSQND